MHPLLETINLFARQLFNDRETDGSTDQYYDVPHNRRWTIMAETPDTKLLVPNDQSQDLNDQIIANIRDLKARTHPTIGQQAVQILGKMVGKQMASFILEKECEKLGYNLHTIEPEELLVLAKHIEIIIRDVFGHSHAFDLGDSLRNLAFQNIDSSGVIIEAVEMKTIEACYKESTIPDDDMVSEDPEKENVRVLIECITHGVLKS